MNRNLWWALAALTVGALPLGAQTPDSMPPGHQHHDTSFAGVKHRGAQAMKVDQDRSRHRFDALPDGGRIELQSTTGDSAAVAGIREHFREIEAAFRAGDFSIPMFVHDRPVPGTDVMAARKDHITYVRRDLPRGAELRMRTTDPLVVKAIHDFIAFQRADHHAGGAGRP